MKSIAPLALIASLTACGAADNDPGPGGVTVGEARALDEAAAMIEERRLPADDAVTEGQTAPEDTPTPETPEPAQE